ncbi:MAG: tetratricopeptide repeat protein [Verrucomicrobiota bacterium]|nr:tetratricopeptide repeat protein [Verrucomicrobiota bacterium]
MPIQTDKDLSGNARALWLKALSAVELHNYGYAISLLQAILKEFPAFLDGRKMLRRAAVQATKGKKSFLSGLSTSSMKGGGMVKKDPLAAMEMAEKALESDPLNAQANHLLKEAAKAAGHPEIAAFALETLVEANPKDTKLMHELGEHYLAMGVAEKAVDVYSKIAEINPSDLIAVKRSKDASATASMKKGGWEQATSYRDLMKNKDEAVSLEQKGRIFKDVETINLQLAEFYPQWEANQENLELSRKIAKLWEDRYEQEPEEEAIQGALYFYTHCNALLRGSDPGVARKLSDLQLKYLEAQIKTAEERIQQLESWFAEGGDQHPDAAPVWEEVQGLKASLPELQRQRAATLIDEARHRVERNPTDLQLRFELGERLLDAGNFNDAIPELQRARQNPSTRLKAMSLLGRCFVQKNMLDMAASQFKSASDEMLAMDNIKKDTVYDLGLVYEKMGKRDDYLNCMKAIMEADYGYKDVAKRVEQSYSDV